MSATATAEGLRFVVADDNGFQRWAITRMLQSLGAASVHGAEDGASALRHVQEARPPVDVIVMDLNMPGMDGIELIRHLRDARSRASLVLVSEQDPALIDSVAAMAQAYGMRLLHATRKPLTPRKLASLLAAREVAPRHAAPLRNFTLPEIQAGMRNGEFVPFFQAKHCLASGRILGAEALARWHHPLHGTVEPATFMKVLVSNDLAHAFSLAILRQAAASCRAWRDAGAMAGVSVNLPSSVLADVSLADRVQDVVASAGLEADDVTLELTEVGVTKPLGRVLENLSRLRLRGFSLSLDHFGTGSAGLQQLGSLPLSEVKIDAALVRAAAGTPAARRVVESALDIASKLGIAAVAMGVDDAATLSWLRDAGCRIAQGNLLDRPLGADDFARRLHGAARVPA